MIKKFGKAFLSKRLENYVRALKAKNDFKTVAVVGSVGKTSTKMAIVKTLEPHARVQYQSGNYNDRLTVPLVVFGHTEPSIFDILAWLKLLRACKRQLNKPYPFDYVVLELGSDGPGQITEFAYLNPDLVVVTALTDEHMEYFKTLDAVAAEELTAVNFSKQALINTADSPDRYLVGLEYRAYAGHEADYSIKDRQPNADGTQTLQLKLSDNTIEVDSGLMGETGAKITLAALSVGSIFGLNQQQLKGCAAKLQPFAGRLQPLAGLKSSTIIDDSYNASPVAVKAALDTLDETPGAYKIALLGNMNEMGELSPSMHTEVGAYCSPKKVDLIVTLGADANEHLAPAAKANGCTVASFDSPYKAGEYIKSKLEPGSVVLVKGSQNRVFAEEAIKSLLADPNDAQKLVRQSDYWLSVKRSQFGDA